MLHAMDDKENVVSSVLKKPIVTEKSTHLQSKNWFGFYVGVAATKLEIQKHIEGVFGEKVEKVSTVSLRGKKKRFRGIVGCTKKRKKAFIKVSNPIKILEFFGGISA
jgi:large subunit ribosomal protein L23